MFDLELDAVQHMRNLAQRAGQADSVEEARKYLGRFGLSGEMGCRGFGARDLWGWGLGEGGVGGRGWVWDWEKEGLGVGVGCWTWPR